MSSLRDRISSARSAGAIDHLLDEGAKYQFATPKTKRRWWTAAAKRRGELDSTPAPAAPPEHVVQAAEDFKAGRGKVRKSGERPVSDDPPKKTKRVAKATA